MKGKGKGAEGPSPAWRPRTSWSPVTGANAVVPGAWRIPKERTKPETPSARPTTATSPSALPASDSGPSAEMPDAELPPEGAEGGVQTGGQWVEASEGDAQPGGKWVQGEKWEEEQEEEQNEGEEEQKAEAQDVPSDDAAATAAATSEVPTKAQEPHVAGPVPLHPVLRPKAKVEPLAAGRVQPVQAEVGARPSSAPSSAVRAGAGRSVPALSSTGALSARVATAGERTVYMKNFPEPWVSSMEAAKLPLKLRALLSQFGDLEQPPAVSASPQAGGLVASARFVERKSAEAAVRVLDGLDRRWQLDVLDLPTLTARKEELCHVALEHRFNLRVGANGAPRGLPAPRGIGVSGLPVRPTSALRAALASVASRRVRPQGALQGLEAACSEVQAARAADAAAAATKAAEAVNATAAAAPGVLGMPAAPPQREAHADAGLEMTCIELAGVPLSWESGDVEELCIPYGSVKEALPATTPGCFFATFHKREAAEKACKALGGLHVPKGGGELATVRCQLLDGPPPADAFATEKPAVAALDEKPGPEDGAEDYGGGPVALYVDELQPAAGEASSADREVFLRNLPVKDCDEEDLRAWLSGFGSVEEAILLRDASTKELTGGGYVRFKLHMEAASLLAAHPADGPEGDVQGFWSLSERIGQGVQGVLRSDVLGTLHRSVERLRADASCPSLSLVGCGCDTVSALGDVGKPTGPMRFAWIGIEDRQVPEDLRRRLAEAVAAALADADVFALAMAVGMSEPKPEPKAATKMPKASRGAGGEAKVHRKTRRKEDEKKDEKRKEREPKKEAPADAKSPEAGERRKPEASAAEGAAAKKVVLQGEDDLPPCILVRGFPESWTEMQARAERGGLPELSSRRSPVVNRSERWHSCL
uniref:RRM domain-containing protein n=1 Tax=Alexandrium monilatum TaxID=311494 RepID=A0A7S4VM47_9DINO